MLKNIIPSHWEEDKWLEVVFDDGEGNGFGFHLENDGSVFLGNEDAKRNYEWCLKHPEKFVRFNEVVTETNRYKVPSTGVCDCGETVELTDQYMGACECPKCGKWYNLFGEELLPPDMWNEEGGF